MVKALLDIKQKRPIHFSTRKKALFCNDCGLLFILFLACGKWQITWNFISSLRSLVLSDVFVLFSVLQLSQIDAFSLSLVPLGHHDNGKEKKLEMDGLRLLKLASTVVVYPKSFFTKVQKHSNKFFVVQKCERNELFSITNVQCQESLMTSERKVETLGDDK